MSADQLFRDLLRRAQSGPVLRSAAEYFQATSGSELKKIYDSLTAKFVLQREQTEITAFFAAAAAALVIAAAGLSLAWFSRIL